MHHQGPGSPSQSQPANPKGRAAGTKTARVGPWPRKQWGRDVGATMKKQLKCVPFYGWVLFHCIFVLRLLYPFISPLTSRLLPCPSYGKWVNCIELQWTLGYMFLFQFGFPWGLCLGVGLLGHMVVLFLVFFFFWQLFKTFINRCLQFVDFFFEKIKL